MLTGTGVYKSDCEPLLEKTFGELVKDGFVQMKDQLEMNDKTFSGMKTINLTIVPEAESDSQMK